MKKLIVMILAAASLAVAAPKPNIVLIFIDDMGYGAIGPFGNTVNKTPNLDRMAAEGVKLTDFYVSNTACTPSRSALMTGCYADRIGMDGSVVFPGEARGLNPQEITIADMLKEQGYVTGCFGKWHLGDQPEFLPLSQGFDTYFGIPYSNDMWPGNKRGNPVTKRGPYEPLPVISDNTVVAHIPDGPNQAVLCDAVTDAAVSFIKKNKGKPFFCYVPHSAIHNPRFSTPERLEQAGGNATRAVTEEVDGSVGRILNTLKELGLEKKTLVFFTSDNGGADGSMGPLRGKKGGSKYEGHMRVSTLAWWPGTIPSGKVVSEIGCSIDLLPTFAKLTGAKVPSDRVIDGQDISALLMASGAKSPHDVLYYEYEGVRKGKWKLVRVKAKSLLFDLEKDIGETTDLAGQFPDKVKELEALLKAHEAKVASARRPAAFAQKPKPLIALGATEDVPTLVEYMGLPPVVSSDDILIADFEGDSYGTWKVEGKAFGKRPAIANVTPRNRVTGYKGKGLVNTYFNTSDKDTGILTSPEFVVERKFINFLVGAGKHEEKTCMNLLVGGKAVRSAVGCARKDGQGREIMLWHSWDVAEFAGKKAVLQIVDDHSGGWGHINIDHIVQSDNVAKGAVADKRGPANRVALSVTMTVDSTHLLVPVANSGKALTLDIFDGDTFVQNFKVVLPGEGTPYWTAAYPLAHFGLAGRNITIKPAGGAKVDEVYRDAFGRIRCGDGIPDKAADDYAKPYRNQFHVSTRRGWNNDPNGMVYHDGKYHLYYQHNPFGIRWGNMHWGHFESTDLIHWKETPIALYQRTTGDMMFSGGGFVDFNNSAGLGENTLFAAFTSTGRGECLAYSKDGGLTFTEIPENPVVKHKGRDPKVIWYEPGMKWVMVIYSQSDCEETNAIEGKRHMAFYESRNLREWTRTGGFTDADQGAVFECPEFFPLEYEAETKWVLLGAQNRYFIGGFNGKTFIKESGPHGSRHGAFYAAQTFSDVPDGRRIQIGWVRTALYVDRFPDQIVNQSFTLPHEMTLVKTPDGLRVAFNPVKEVEKLRGKKLKSLDDCKGELTEVLIEFEEAGQHVLVINGIDASFEGKSARIFTDRTFNEVYADGGLYYEVRTRSPQDFDSMETAVKKGKVKSLKIYRLKSIWDR